jgi:hypothetical protein
MAVTAPGSDVWVLSTPESARADAKSATSSSKSATHGRPHDSDDTLGASLSPALAVMLQRFSRRVNWAGGGFYELTRVTLALQYLAVNSKSKPCK